MTLVDIKAAGTRTFRTRFSAFSIGWDANAETSSKKFSAVTMRTWTTSFGAGTERNAGESNRRSVRVAPAAQHAPHAPDGEDAGNQRRIGGAALPPALRSGSHQSG